MDGNKRRRLLHFPKLPVMQPTPEAASLQALVARFAAQRILVIGDLMLDEFIWGRVSRISPEAPVPVVEVTGESYYCLLYTSPSPRDTR